MADRQLPLPPGLTPAPEGLPELAVRRDQARRRAYANLLDGGNASEARQANIAGRELGLPPATVQADPLGFQREIENRDTLNILADPHVTAFVQDPSAASAVKDDLPSLAEMSAIVRLRDESEGDSFNNYMKRTVKGKGLISALTMLPRPKPLSFERGGSVDPNQPMVVDRPRKIGRAEGLLSTASNFVWSGAAGAELYLADALGVGSGFEQSDFYKVQRGIVEATAGVAAAPNRQLQEDPDVGPLAKWAGMRAYEAAQSLAVMGAAIATGGPITALALGTGGQQYGDVRARGGTANEALFSGAVSGAAEGFFEKYFGLGWMLGNFGKKATGKFIGGLLLREVPSEVATTAVQDFADAVVTGGQGFDSYLKQHTALSADNPLVTTAASTALLVGAVGGGHYATRRLLPEQRSMEEIGKAAAGAEFVDRLMAAGEQSKTRKEDPETIRQFVAQRTDATPVRNLYVPVEAVATYMQQEDYDGSLDRYQDQIAQAQATQGDVVIPIADAVAHLAGTKTWEAIRDEARVEPGGLSRKEAQEKHADIIKVLEQRGEEIAAEAKEADGKLSDSAEVYTEIKNRLRIAGIDDKQADAVAQLYAARYEARAGRMGGTAMEQLKKSKISFPGEKPGQFDESREVAQDAVVNIGLAVPGGGALTPEEATSALRDLGIDITTSEVRQSATEPTLIARLSRALTAKEGKALSAALKQEAIAQRVGKKGKLFGPKAKEWGPFNEDLFLSPESARALNQIERRVPRQDVLPEGGWSPERVSGLIDLYGKEDGGSNAIAVMMSPDEFLALTASAEGIAMIEKRVIELPQYGDLDADRLAASGPIGLTVARGGENDTRPPPMIRGHEGRHRMMMLKRAGVRQVPVLVKLTDKDGKVSTVKEPLRISNVLGNRSRGNPLETSRVADGVVEGIPVSWRYKEQLAELQERVFNQSPDEAFYSAAQRVVENAPQDKASAQQWKALLTPGKTPGIKSEEIEWTGIHDWLDMQKGPIEKGALLQVLRDRGIQVEEVVLGENADKVREDGIQGIMRDIPEYSREQAEDFWDNDPEVRADIGHLSGGVQFGNWSSDPSNPTYRELLITLPLGQGSNPDRAPSTHWDTEGVVAHVRFMEKTDAEGKRVLFIEEVQSDWHQKGRDQGYEAGASAEEIAQSEAVQAEARQAYFAAEEAARAEADRLLTLERLKPDADQDWIAYIENNLDAIVPQVRTNVLREVIGQLGSDNVVLENMDRADLRLSEATQMMMNRQGKTGIPEAPFKTSWPALVMKRAIRWAVDHGYERIAWTTGEEQAERYNLSTVVGKVTAAPKAGGGYVIGVQNYNVINTLAENGLAERLAGSYAAMTREQLVEGFGQDLGNRIAEAADAAPEASASDQSFYGMQGLTGYTDRHAVTIEGNDLRIGGEGMKAFYDRNLVNITNDIIKKYGAKVGSVRVKGEDPQRAGLVNLLAKQHGLATYGIGSRAEAEARIEEYKRNIAEGVGDTDKAGEWIAHLQDALPIIDRIEAIDANPGVPHPGFEITDKLREAASSGFALFQGPRGTTTITNEGQHIIQLFATANRSTLLHESAHIWLEELKGDAAENDDAKRDYEIVKKWWASQGVKVGKSGFIPTEGHELWARGFERYLMEGKAPSQALQGVFKTFRAWLMRIYQVVQNLGSPITPEIREVFDRLLATQEAIDDARAQNPSPPLFKTAEEAQMTDAEFADYQSRIANARDEAYDTLLFKTMESIRKAKNAERRQQRASIRDEVAGEIARQPQFRLLHLLRTGRWLGDPDREAVSIKLNTGWLIDNFGEDVLEKLPRGIQIHKGNGETGDVVAEMVGLGSGVEVVQTLLGMRAASDALRARGETRSMRDVMVEEEVERLMAARHGDDPLNDGTIEEEAIAALNTARQGEIIAAEARQLAKRKSVLGVPTPYQFAREWAKRTVGAGHVRDVASRAAMQRYTRGANKAARLAEEAILAGDVDEAYRQKQAQLLNHALLAESKAAADEIDRIVSRMRKLAGRAAMKSVDQDYMDKVHMLLERYDFRPRSQKSIDEQEGFQKWLEQQRARGFEVHIPPRLENNGDPYTRVSVQELMSLNDLVESLMSLGRAKQKLTAAGQERDFAEFRDEVTSRIERLPDRKASKERWWHSGKLRKVSPINENERLLASASAELLKVETIVEELDGGPTGPLHDAIVLGATTAENRRYALRERVLKPMSDAYHRMSRKQRKRLHERVTIPELTWNTLNEGDPRLGDPVTMTRMELISVFLNMGNISNLEKMSKGERWPVATLNAVVNRELTKEDMDFAQLLWDKVDSLWPDIVSVERALSGVVPEKVIPSPIVTQHGEYKGGYWPVVYDAARWQLAEDMEGKEVDDMFGLKSGVATQKGHTITRTAANGPINFSLENVLFRHVEQVVTRIAFAEYARDTMRIVRDRSIRGWIDTKLGPEYRKQIEKWLARQVHEGAVYAKAARWWDRLMRQARINVTIAAMGLRISTGVAQTLGLAASAQRIGARWVGTGMKILALNPRNATAFAFTRSPELLHRAEAVNRELAEISAKLRNKYSWWTNAQAWAMWHIGLIDRYVVALPTWLGAHAKATAEGMTDEQATAFADKSVRLSQGAGREKDLSAVQSPNSEAMRFFTMFYSPFNVMFNAQWQGVRGLKRGDVRPMIGVTFWWMMASMLGDALMSGDWPDPEDEDSSWVGWFGRNVFFGMFAGIPLARDAANAAERNVMGKYVSDPGTTPITRVWQAVTKGWKQGGKIKEGEDIDAPIKQAGDISAVLTGLPTSQIGTTAQFAWDVEHEDTDPQDLSDWYFGITRGKVPSEEDNR